MKTSLLILLSLGLAQDSKNPDVVVFFTPQAAKETAILLKNLEPGFRVVMLVRDFAKLGEELETPEMIELVTRTGEIPIWDMDGLELARALKIRQVPVVAAKRGNTWHIASGSDADVKELFSCKR